MSDSDSARTLRKRNPLIALPALLLMAACGDAHTVGLADEGADFGFDDSTGSSSDTTGGQAGTSLPGDTSSSTTGDTLLDADELGTTDSSATGPDPSDEVDTSTSLLGTESTPEPDATEPDGSDEGGTTTGTESGNPTGGMPSTGDSGDDQSNATETGTPDQTSDSGDAMTDDMTAPGATGDTATGATDGGTAVAGVSCTSDDACVAGEFCQFPVGACSGTGQCVALLEGCMDSNDPVCGCDGMTYSNSCEPRMIGVSVVSIGECPGSGPGDGSCDVDGTSYPDGSSDIPAPDGCNTCSCSAGLLACTERACQQTGEICGGFAGFTCVANEYCAYAPGDLCGAADATATCQPRPEACITLYDPVCGCDGNTYGNSCEAAAAGTGVLEVGECQPAR